ncbi:alpha/beta-hydrolase [Gigaspora margarita]|uniref:Alpha/beta-hydrolase n=1 Tax=Gigaspora margarita TaxID=4874 RepID=A0A8H4ASM2_GIGMA|nr:alpha/beta-hydrolase [Gigaspora margarita]
MAQPDSVIIDNLDENDGKNNISPEQLIHFVDLVNTPKPSLNPIIRRIPLISQSLTYLIYFKLVVIYLFLTLLFNITLPITNPLEFIITFALFPLFTALVYFFEVGIKFIIFLQSLSHSGNNQKVIDLWSSFTNKDIKEILHAGIASLDDPDNHSDDNRSVDIKKITDKLLESEREIQKEAKEIGLEFISITECNVIEGPYGGLYWSESHNFIIVSFKGTDPLNLAEWLTNFSLQRMDAKQFLFGEVHSGYYNNLFPNNSYSSTKSVKQFPALRLVEAIRGKANEIYKRTAQRVKVWVTGYSLGGALATLFYARLLQSPASLGDNVDICDGITFASPLLGDNDFAAGFQSLMNNEINVNKNFWRIVNDNDIVPRYPFGFHVPNLGHFLSKINLFNYINVGDEVRFYQDGSKPSSERHLYGSDINYLFIKQELNLVDLGTFFGFYDQFDSSTNGWNSIKNIFTVNYKVNSNIDYVTPGFIRNHYSYRYFECLEKARKYWEEPKKNDER